MKEPLWKSHVREGVRALIVILGASLFAFCCAGMLIQKAKWDAECNQGDWKACALDQLTDPHHTHKRSR